MDKEIEKKLVTQKKEERERAKFASVQQEAGQDLVK